MRPMTAQWSHEVIEELRGTVAKCTWLVEWPSPTEGADAILLARAPSEQEATRLAAYFGYGATVRNEQRTRRARS